ncbi:unnamed protein product [Dovyalis caffra]|uniref:Uncharacterized protein n=1 Tax=Dovyalis caffra TaxID=77055 RepID=A0AAV1RQP4_9ROSI|nr:unnamed protein product [Dovyalis caffra]
MGNINITISRVFLPTVENNKNQPNLVLPDPSQSDIKAASAQAGTLNKIQLYKCIKSRSMNPKTRFLPAALFCNTSSKTKKEWLKPHLAKN